MIVYGIAERYEDGDFNMLNAIYRNKQDAKEDARRLANAFSDRTYSIVNFWLV